MPSTAANTANPGTFASLLTGIGNTSQGSPQGLSGISGTGGTIGELYGQVPGVSNPIGSEQTALKGDIGNLTGSANLTQGTDIITAEGAQLPFNLNLPGYESMLGDASANTQQELEGEIPQDVQNQLATSAAERGVATGQGGNSPNTNAALLQALGLTSLGQQQQGQANLSTLIGETPTGASFNPASMYVTTPQQQQAEQASMNAQAAADPGASGIFSSIMSLI